MAGYPSKKQTWNYLFKILINGKKGCGEHYYYDVCVGDVLLYIDFFPIEW